MTKDREVLRQTYRIVAVDNNAKVVLLSHVGNSSQMTCEWVLFPRGTVLREGRLVDYVVFERSRGTRYMVFEKHVADKEPNDDITVATGSKPKDEKESERQRKAFRIHEVRTEEFVIQHINTYDLLTLPLCWLRTVSPPRAGMLLDCVFYRRPTVESYMVLEEHIGVPVTEPDSTPVATLQRAKDFLNSFHVTEDGKFSQLAEAYGTKRVTFESLQEVLFTMLEDYTPYKEPHVLTVPGHIPDEQFERFKKEWNALVMVSNGEPE